MRSRLTRKLFSRTIVFPEDVKERLRKPLGLLVRGRPEEVMLQLPQLLAQLKPSQIISVGDVTSGMLLELGLRPKVMVVDGRVERRRYPPPGSSGYETVRVENPPGCISAEAAEMLERALESGEYTMVLVDGEEDLLALPAIYLMPDDAVVLYGQPGAGCVIVRGGRDIRRLVEEIMLDASRRT
jgi:uncharacterized protein (UPF0218 family)